MEIVNKIEDCNGLVHERFAFTQSMTIENFVDVAESLRKSGYRPFRVRPYPADGTTLVAGIWTRDGKRWELTFGLTKEEVIARCESMTSQGLVPEDLAGYSPNNHRYALLSVEGDNERLRRKILIGIPREIQQAEYDRMTKQQKLMPLTKQLFAGEDSESDMNQIFEEPFQRRFGQASRMDAKIFSTHRLDHTLLDVDLFEEIKGNYVGTTAVHLVIDRTENQRLVGLDESEHVERSRILANDGYRMTAISVIRKKSDGQSITVSSWNRPLVTEEARDKYAKQQANAAVALLGMNQAAKVWPLLKHSPDPRVRSYLIHRFGPLGADARIILDRVSREDDITIQRGLLLSLGEFDETQLPLDLREQFLPKFQDLYRKSNDAGLHAAAEWLLRKWNEEAWIKKINSDWGNDKEWKKQRLAGLRSKPPAELARQSPTWIISNQGQTMVVIPGPVEFMMGSPPDEPRRDVDETQHRRRIERTFAVSSKLVTVDQYKRFDKNAYVNMELTPSRDCPFLAVDWYSAAAYCNWLSRSEGITEDQWCYVGKGNETQLKEGYLSLTGYRLPTEAEMEYTIRAGATTMRFFGATTELLKQYAWNVLNSEERTWPAGMLKPNDCGIFDAHGNAYTWCQETLRNYPKVSKGDAVNDIEDRELSISDVKSRVFRGNAWNSRESAMRSANRGGNVPTTHDGGLGFRIARTIVDLRTSEPSSASEGDSVEKPKSVK